MINPKFPEPDKNKILKKLRSLPVVGKPLQTSRNLACISCGKSVLPLGRLAWSGGPLCSDKACEYTSLSAITSLFQTPYGRAINQHILRIFARSLDNDRIIIQRNPVADYAVELVDGYLELLRWQIVFHDYERLTHPDAYSKGAISLVPPRRLDDVLIFRSLDRPRAIDPTRNLKPSIAILLRRVYSEGPSALNVPF